MNRGYGNKNNFSQSFPNPITVDERKPKTKLQIRLADGTKLVQEFNHDHLISDVFMFVGCQVKFGFSLPRLQLLRLYSAKKHFQNNRVLLIFFSAIQLTVICLQIYNFDLFFFLTQLLNMKISVITKCSVQTDYVVG